MYIFTGGKVDNIANRKASMTVVAINIHNTCITILMVVIAQDY